MNYSQLSHTPGISFRDLILSAKNSAVRSLIDQSVVDVLELLEPTLLEGEGLGRLATKLLDPMELVQDSQSRRRLIELLPLLKARELANRLGIAADRQVYANLIEAAEHSSNLPAIKTFLGIVEDIRVPGESHQDISTCSPKYSLFAHQRDAASKVSDALATEPRTVVLHMPTGSGKTRTTMHIVADHLMSNEPTVVTWLAHSEELLEQAASEFETAWSHLGNRELKLIRFWGSRRPDILSIRDGVIVAGLGKMNSLDRRVPNTVLQLADRSSLTIIDEAHQALAPTYESLLNSLLRKRPRNALLGLTATPGRTWADVLEDAKLSNIFNRRKVTLEVEGYNDPITFLIERGFLSRPSFSTLNSDAGLSLTKQDIRSLSRSIDVPSSILERLGNDSQRNLRIVAQVEELTKRHSRILVFAPSVRNARLLSAVLSARGFEAEAVTAQTPSIERERLLRRFRNDQPNPKILCNYGVLTTGFDAPSISAAVIARPTRSLVLYSQMVGRATRGPIVGGNPTSEIITVLDPDLPGFGSIVDAFNNWEDVWNDTID